MTEKLKALEEEYRKGRQMLADLDERRAEIRDTLLRISGAIQVLKELSAVAPSGGEVLSMAGD